MTRLMKGKGFLYTGGSFVDTITVRPKPEDDDYALHLDGSSAILTLSEEQAVQVAVDLVTALYDGDRLPMEAAERLQYLASAVLGEKARRCACACGCDYRLDGYAPDEDICGACEDNCDGSTAPTCDICGVREEESTLEWDGENGLHVECQRTHQKCPTCNGAGATGAPWDPDTCTSCRGTGWVVLPGFEQYVAERKRLGL